jgi:hypothetical protein
VLKPETDIILLPVMANSLGLVPAAFAEPDGAASTNDVPAQRFRLTSPEAVFAADRFNRASDVSTQSTTEFVFEPIDVRVEQRIEYYGMNQSKSSSSRFPKNWRWMSRIFKFTPLHRALLVQLVPLNQNCP